MAATETTRRARPTRGALAWLIAGVGYLIVEALAAAAVEPSYSYAEAYISALGVPAWSPLAHLMNTAFVVQGALFFVGAVLMARAAQKRAALFLGFAAANALGNILVATVHGGSPLAAGDGMRWHVVGAILVFLFGNAAIIAGTSIVARAGGARWWYRAVSFLMGAAGFVSVAMLANYNLWAIEYVPVGLVERGAVYSILAWQIFSAVVVLTRPTGRD